MLAVLSIALNASPAFADDYQDTVNVFKKAMGNSTFFDTAHAYAVFPTIGKGGFVLGGAFGNGRVYEQGKYIGDTSVTQLTLGLQIGGEGFSQIIFFEDRRALNEFTSGDFAFGARASAVALTAAAQAQAGTAGASAGASGSQYNAVTVATYNNGMATFTIAKGGFMSEATIGGEQFSYKPR
jgi:lipid-binding SYLF domain-containing protein